MELLTEPTRAWEELNQVWRVAPKGFLVCFVIRLLQLLEFLLCLDGLTECLEHNHSQQEDVLGVSLWYPCAEIIESLDAVLLVVQEVVAQELVEDALVRVEGAETDVGQIGLVALDGAAGGLGRVLLQGLIASIKSTDSVGPRLAIVAREFSVGALCCLEIDDGSIIIL